MPRVNASGNLCLAAHGFPHLLTITWPLCPSVLSNIMVSIEHHVGLITDYIGYVEQNGIDRIDPAAETEKEWGRNAMKSQTSPCCRTPAPGVEGKPSQVLPYLDGVHNYGRLRHEIADDGYRGFTIRSRETAGAAS